MGDLVYHEAVLVGIWLETLVYGIYVPLFFTCIWIVLYRRGVRPVNWKLLGPAIVMFILSTVHIGVGIRRLIEGFVQSPNPALYYADLQRWKNVWSDAIYVTINLIGDSIVIYRCYVVWNYQKRVIVLPLLCLIGSVVTGIYAVIGFHYVKPGDTAFVMRISAFARADFVLSLVVNVMCTGLIAFHIWRSARFIGPHLGRQHVGVYYGALAVIVESAAIYTLSMAIYIGLYVSEMNAQYVLYLVNTQIIGIVPTLILVRVGLGLTHTSGWDTAQGSNLPYSHGGVFIARGNNPIQIRREREMVTDGSISLKTSRNSNSAEYGVTTVGYSPAGPSR